MKKRFVKGLLKTYKRRKLLVPNDIRLSFYTSPLHFVLNKDAFNEIKLFDDSYINPELFDISVYDEKANIFVDNTCCAGVTPEKHNAALEVMKSCQINVI